MTTSAPDGPDSYAGLWQGARWPIIHTDARPCGKIVPEAQLLRYEDCHQEQILVLRYSVAVLDIVNCMGIMCSEGLDPSLDRTEEDSSVKGAAQ